MAACCALAVVACGSGGDASSGDALVVTPDPGVTPQAATEAGFTCTPNPPPEGTVSDLVVAGPCAVDYFGSAHCTRSGGGFDASITVPLRDGGGDLSLDVKVRGGVAAVALALARAGVRDDWGATAASAAVAKDGSSVTVRPVALAEVTGRAGGVETVRGVLTCG